MAMSFPDRPPPDLEPCYSDSTLQWNIKPRKVTCPVCAYEVITELAGPKCGHCRSQLITVMERSDSELARRTSTPT